MATFNPALPLAENQALWIQNLITWFGATRSFTIKHWPAAPGNATDADVWANGTVVWQSDLTGTLSPSNGALRKLGKVKNVTIHPAADLSVGKAVACVAGGGNEMLASIGLVGSDREIKIPPLTGNKGLAFGVNFAIYPPQNIPVDAGIDRDMPYRIEYEPWEGGSPGVRQVAIFDNPQPAIVLADPVKAARLGPIPYTQSNITFINGDGYADGGYKFELGIHRFRLPPSCNDEDPTKPVWQVMFFGTPKDRWASYPIMTDYNVAFDSTFYRPFKVYIYTQDGRLLEVIQSKRDQTPINDPTVTFQKRNSTKAWRPPNHVAGALYYCSHRLKEAPEAAKFYAGTNRTYWDRPKQAKQRSASNALIGSFDINSQVNGFMQVLLMPEWSQPSSRAGFDVDAKTDTNVSWESGNNPTGNFEDGGAYPTHATGWRHDHGAFNAGQEPTISPGGLRAERYGVTSLLAYYMSHRAGARLQGNIPWRTVLDEYGKGFFSHHWHHLKNAKTLETFSVAEAAYGQIGYWEAYYNAHANGVTQPGSGPEGWIRLHGFNPNGWTYNTPNVDRDGLRQFNAWMNDSHHPYRNPGVFYTHFDSIAHAIEQKFAWFSMVMAWNRYNASPGANLCNLTNYEGTEENMQMFMRQHTWRWLALAFAWEAAGSAPLVPRDDVEEVWRLELESLYDNAVVPATDSNHPNYNHYFFQGMRNLGTPIRRIVSGENHYYNLFNDDKRFYFTSVLVWMKTMGCFDRLRQINTKCAAALDWAVECYTKAASDRMVATKGAKSYGQIVPSVPTTTALVVPANWEEVASVMQPDRLSDMVRNADGSPYWGIIPGTTSDYGRDRWLYQHIMQQSCYDLNRHFTSYATPNVATAAAMCDDFEAFVHADMTSGVYLNSDYVFRYIATGPMLADPA